MLQKTTQTANAAVEIYIKILEIVYPTFLGTTLIPHAILLLFIIFFSPCHLKFLRILLLKTSIFDVLATVINFYIQPRILADKKENIPVYCYGLCREMNTQLCFSLYMAWQTLSLAVAISMSYTLFFKYHKINGKGPLVGWRMFISMFLFYIPCFISTICSVIIVLRNTLPMSRKVGDEDDDEVEITDMRYSEIGRMTLGKIPNKVNFAMMSYGIYFSPILAFWFRWKSNKNLKTTISGASPYLQYHAKSVMTGLALQVFMHFIFYIPLFSLYLYSLYTGTEILFQQFFLAMSPNLAATFDPLINLYYVVPYRTRIKSWFERSQPQQTSPLRVASITPSAIG